MTEQPRPDRRAPSAPAVHRGFVGHHPCGHEWVLKPNQRRPARRVGGQGAVGNVASDGDDIPVEVTQGQGGGAMNRHEGDQHPLLDRRRPRHDSPRGGADVPEVERGEEAVGPRFTTARRTARWRSPAPDSGSEEAPAREIHRTVEEPGDVLSRSSLHVRDPDRRHRPFAAEQRPAASGIKHFLRVRRQQRGPSAAVPGEEDQGEGGLRRKATVPSAMLGATSVHGIGPTPPMVNRGGLPPLRFAEKRLMRASVPAMRPKPVTPNAAATSAAPGTRSRRPAKSAARRPRSPPRSSAAQTASARA